MAFPPSLFTFVCWCLCGKYLIYLYYTFPFVFYTVCCFLCSKKVNICKTMTRQIKVCTCGFDQVLVSNIATIICYLGAYCYLCFCVNQNIFFYLNLQKSIKPNIFHFIFVRNIHPHLFVFVISQNTHAKSIHICIHITSLCHYDLTYSV